MNRSVSRGGTAAVLVTAVLSWAMPVAAADKAEPLTDVIAGKGFEGAVADLEGNFYFCNLRDEKLVPRVNGNLGVLPAGSREPKVLMTFEAGMKGNGLRLGPDGHLYMADQMGYRVVRIDLATKSVTVLHDFPDIPRPEKPSWQKAPNDVAITPDGRHLYVSCAGSGVYRMTLDGAEVTKVHKGFANGIDVSPDGKTLHLAQAYFAIQPDGSLKKKPGLKVELPGAKSPKTGRFTYTDGLRCDAEGNVYVCRAALGRPGAIHVLSPAGKHLRDIELPHQAAHNLAFGGKEGKTLFIVCPGKTGFIATYENDIPGANRERLKQWAERERE